MDDRTRQQIKKDLREGWGVEDIALMLEIDVKDVRTVLRDAGLLGQSKGGPRRRPPSAVG